MKRPSLNFYFILIVLALLFGILWKLIGIITIAAILSIVMRKYVFEKLLQWNPPKNAAILITGTSSGFGRLFAYLFASQGILVFAGVRKQADGEMIVKNAPTGAKKLIVPVILDITKQDQVLSAPQVVRNRLEKEGRRLFALINNAGVQTGGPLESLPLSEVRSLFEVNYFGQIAVTQSFLPLLREYQGPEGARILFVGSASGFTSLPYQSAYASSKHALEAVADALRVELHHWKIKVSIIEPGVFNTAMAQKAHSMEDPSSPTIPAISGFGSDGKDLETSLYPSYSKWQDGARAIIRNAPTGEPVATTAQSILYAKFPPARAAVGMDSILSAQLVYIYPDTLLDFIWRNRLVGRVANLFDSLKKK